MSRKYQAGQFIDPNGGIVESRPNLNLIGFFQGVPTASQPGYEIGAIAVDVTNGNWYRNTGTTTAATWTRQTGTITAETITTLTATTATITTLNVTSIVRASQTYKVGGGRAKVGTSAGWVVGAANNLGTIATMAASQSGGTLVVPVTGLHVGDTITGFGVYSSINSAGGTVTLDADLRKLVIAAGANATDSSIGSITQVSVATATASSATKTGLTEVVAAGTQYYILLTGTTAGSTTIELAGLEVTVTSA